MSSPVPWLLLLASPFRTSASSGFQGLGFKKQPEQEFVDGCHLTINSGLNFSKFPVVSGTAISAFFENSVKEDNLAGEVYPNFPKQFFSRKFPFHSIYTSRGIPKFSEKFSRKLPFHSILFPGIFGWMVRIMRLNNCRSFRETFQTNFFTEIDSAHRQVNFVTLVWCSYGSLSRHFPLSPGIGDKWREQKF